LERLARDPSPAVRLEAIRALAKIPEARSAEIALSVLDQPMDPTLDYALWLTINEISTPWIEALESGAWKTEGRERQLEFALKAIPPSQASRVLSRLLESRPLDPAGSGPWIEIIGQAGGPAELRKLLNTVTAGTFQPAAAQRAIRSLMDAQRLRKIRTEGDAAAIPALLQNPEAGIRESSATWAGLLKDAGRVAQLGQLAGGDPSAPVRQACFQALRQIGGAPVITLLRTQATQGPAENRGEAVAALAALDPSAALEPTLALLPGIQDENAALALFRGLLSQKGFAKSLAGALDARPQTTGARFLPENVARAGMRVAREGGRNEMELVVALAKAAGLAPDAQSFTAGLIKDLAAKAAQSGDPARGEMIYRRDSLACTACRCLRAADRVRVRAVSTFIACRSLACLSCVAAAERRAREAA
jgi:HEAT repeat protein